MSNLSNHNYFADINYDFIIGNYFHFAADHYTKSTSYYNKTNGKLRTTSTNLNAKYSLNIANEDVNQRAKI